MSRTTDKRKVKKGQKKTGTSSIGMVTGFSRIIEFFKSEKVHFMFGILLLAVSVCMVWAFVSFFTTGASDQSIIENLHSEDMANQNRLFNNAIGSIGAWASYFFMNRCFGIAAFGIPLYLVMLSLALMRAYRVPLLKWFMCIALLMIWSSVVLAIFVTPLAPESHFCLGGQHGLFIGDFIERYVGTPGLVAILALVALSFLTYVSSETILWIRKLINPSKFLEKVKFTVTNNDKDGDEENSSSYENLIQTEEDPEVFDDPIKEVIDFNHQTHVGDSGKEKNHEKPKSQDIPDMPVVLAGDVEKADGQNVTDTVDMEPYDPKRDLENYHYPTLDLLQTYESDGKPYIDMDEQNANKNRIIDVLRNFGIEISSIRATVGPTITLYEITPAQGVRIAKIRNLEDDIALSLKALGIRIIAPIPGKGTIGIEVPNAKANIVSMESILNSKKFQETTMELPCAMGKTITNEVFMFDLAKAPHLLVAGATGQGKSVGLNAILTSLLYKKHPAELKIVLVDPKMVEFSIYKNIDKHFLAALPDEAKSPIITDTSKVIRTLQSLCVEMDARYELLMAAGERNIKDYNKKFIARKLNPEKGHRYMPYIVVVIDEFGDLIMTAGKEIELPIARIAQKARAVGIHMVIATQRPTTNIITGTIKANFPARIAFKVSQGIDSKTILDRMGAQQLIGRGDMLYLQGNDPVRVQCAFVDTPEVDRINQFISQQQGYLEPYELPEPPASEGEGMSSGSNDADLSHLDPMFDDAARLIVHEQSGSTSLIQRKFAIGYNRAGRLMDQLEKAGIVGAAHGSKPREVLIQDDMSLENLLSSLR